MAATTTKGSKTGTLITCDDNSCSGTYVGLEFDSTKPQTDIAHQFSNDMAEAVGNKLKELYRSGKYTKVDFSKIEMTTAGMDQNADVTYYLKIPFIGVSTKCDAYTSFEHVGGWGHDPALDKMKTRLASGLLPGQQLDISDLKKTPEGLQEYWIQWKNKNVQADCANPASSTPSQTAPSQTAPSQTAPSQTAPTSQQVSATPSNTKFKITISGSTSDWSDPIEFKDGVDAKTDLPIFHVFIGEEIKYSDPFTDFEDADYDSLDPEYTEEGVQGLLPEEYDLVTNFPEVDVTTAAQALFGSYGNSVTEESSAQVGWSGPAYWGMTVKEITISAGGKSSKFKVWNTEAVGGDGKLNLFKALISGDESAGNYYAFNYGTNGSDGLSISSWGFSKGKPIKRTKLFDITMTFDEVRKKQLYNTKPGLFAVGKYQAVPTTLNSHIPKLKCGSQQMSPYWQEKLGESLIINRGPLWNYITGKNDGSQSKLEAAITSAGQEWASLPVCKTPDRYDTKITIVNGKKKKNKVLVAKGQTFNIESNPSANAAYYGGVGINPGKSKKNLATVAVILIETRKIYTGSDDFYKPKWYKPLSFSV